jgi:predicted nucleotidyltransferase component of viral defense system
VIQPAEIARLAHRLGLGDKTIEKDYALTWTLLAVADSPLRDRLAFKGGTALKKVYVPEYRFSEDLDDCRSRNQTLRVYSPEEIRAEKLCALLGRTEPRDLYDVHYILCPRSGRCAGGVVSDGCQDGA